MRGKYNKTKETPKKEEENSSADEDVEKKRRKSSEKLKARKPKGECHVCEKKLPNMQLATCINKYCRTQFCAPCAQNKFQKV